MYTLFLGFKYLFSRWINLLGVIGVTVGVWALIVVISIFSGFIRDIRKHIRGAASDMAFIAGDRGQSYSKLEAILKADPNVKDCAPHLKLFGLIFPKNPPSRNRISITDIADPDVTRNEVLVEILGIDPEREKRVTDLPGWLVALEKPRLRVRNPDEPFAKCSAELIRAELPPDSIEPVKALARDPVLILGENRLERLGLRPGAGVRLLSVKIEQPPGRAPVPHPVQKDFIVAGGFRSKHSSFDSQYGLVHIDDLREVLGEHTHNPGGYVDLCTEVAIQLHDYSQAKATIDRLMPAFRRGGIIEGGLITWEDRNRNFLGAVDNERGLMKLVLWVISVVAGFLIFATLSMMVSEKTKDVGILTAMGATKTGILMIFLICGGIIGLFGCVFGIATGWYSAIHLNDVNEWFKVNYNMALFDPSIYKLAAVPYELDPLWTAQVAGIAYTIAILFSVIPAWRAARLDPVEALRYE